MKKVMLSFAALVLGFMSFQSMAFEGKGSVGLYNKTVYRGLDTSAQSPSIIGAVEAEVPHLRVGATAYTLQSRGTNFRYDTYGEVFTTVLNNEVKIGLKSTNHFGQSAGTNSVNELYLGTSGVIYDVGYNVTGYRKQNTGDIFVNTNMSKTFDSLTVSVGTAYSNYATPVAGLKQANGFEYVNLKTSYLVTNNVQLSAEIIEPVGDKLINGITAKRQFVIGSAVLF